MSALGDIMEQAGPPCLPSSAVEILKAGRAKIVKGWTQGIYARDIYGDKIADSYPGAVSWCAYGAVHGACNGWAPYAVVRYLIRALPEGWESVSDYNDDTERTQSDILRLYDNAITIAKSEVGCKL